MSRSKWKLPIIFFKRSQKIMTRNCQITESVIDNSVSVYTGKNFVKVKVTREKVGYKYGFFSFSKRYTKKMPKGKTKGKTPTLTTNKKNAKK